VDLIGFCLLIIGIVINIYAFAGVWSIIGTSIEFPFYVHPLFAVAIFVLSFIAAKIDIHLGKNRKLAARVVRASWVLALVTLIVFFICFEFVYQSTIAQMD
jgi:hypothetical protein